MTLKEFKKILKFFNKNAVVKINGKDISVTYSRNQDDQWTVNIAAIDSDSCSEQK